MFFRTINSTKKNELEHCPPYNPPFLDRLSKFSHENCLSYALSHRLDGPNLFERAENINQPLEHVVSELNRYYQDPDLAMIAEHEVGKLPVNKKEYYIISLSLSYNKGYNIDETLYQALDYHFLVQNNDGYFSHRRGNGKAERLDSNGNLILLPEHATLFYIDNHSKKKYKIRYNYEFVGYIYIKITEKRIQAMCDIHSPTPIKSNKQTIPQWVKHDDFSIKYECSFFRIPMEDFLLLNRELILKNQSPYPKIKKITFQGFQNSTLRLCILFKNIDICNEFLDRCPYHLVASSSISFVEKNIYFSPSSQREFDEFLQLLHQFDPINEEILKELPRLLNIQMSLYTSTEDSLKHYSPFDPNYPANTYDRNCLSYALLSDMDLPYLGDLIIDTGMKNANKLQPLEYVVSLFNQDHQDAKFAFVAPHETGKLPIIKEGYYVIALALSYEKGLINNGSLFQAADYHFLVQNNDGYFSHKRGKINSPERVDSENNVIKTPETSRLFYVNKSRLHYNDNGNKVFECYDYQFIGYLYIKTPARRLKNIPFESFNRIEEIEKKVKDSRELQTIYDNFKKKFFLYPPLPEFFPDAQAAIVELYHTIHTAYLSTRQNFRLP